MVGSLGLLDHVMLHLSLGIKTIKIIISFSLEK